jgi:hypothetical protein
MTTTSSELDEPATDAGREVETSCPFISDSENQDLKIKSSN